VSAEEASSICERRRSKFVFLFHKNSAQAFGWSANLLFAPAGCKKENQKSEALNF